MVVVVEWQLGWWSSDGGSQLAMEMVVAVTTAVAVAVLVTTVVAVVVSTAMTTLVAVEVARARGNWLG